MQQQKRSRCPKRRADAQEPGKSWMKIEYYLCVLALVIAIAMTGTGVSHLLYAAGEASRDAAASQANEPEYVTFIRGVVNHLTDTDRAKAAGKDSFSVDLSQFADDTGYGGQVYALRDTYPEQVEKILTNYENAVLTIDGQETTVGEQSRDAIPERLLQLVINNVETIDFVAGYSELHNHSSKIDLSAEANSGTVPLLLQWDTRWGYEGYGDGLICYTGCGPTCLSMVAMYLNNDPEITPKEVSDYADRAGYYTNGVGSAWSLMGEGCAHYGLTGTEMPISESGMAEKLAEGCPLICAMGPGDFTQSGHFIVISAYSADGQFTVNDPNSKIRSSQTWSYETLSSQIKNIWYFEKADS